VWICLFSALVGQKRHSFHVGEGRAERGAVNPRSPRGARKRARRAWFAPRGAAQAGLTEGAERSLEFARKRMSKEEISRRLRRIPQSEGSARQATHSATLVNALCTETAHDVALMLLPDSIDLIARRCLLSGLRKPRTLTPPSRPRRDSSDNRSLKGLSRTQEECSRRVGRILKRANRRNARKICTRCSSRSRWSVSRNRFPGRESWPSTA
jgi:hypothetical protein